VFLKQPHSRQYLRGKGRAAQKAAHAKKVMVMRLLRSVAVPRNIENDTEFLNRRAMMALAPCLVPCMPERWARTNGTLHPARQRQVESAQALGVELG